MVKLNAKELAVITLNTVLNGTLRSRAGEKFVRLALDIGTAVEMQSYLNPKKKEQEQDGKDITNASQAGWRKLSSNIKASPKSMSFYNRNQRKVGSGDVWDNPLKVFNTFFVLVL